MLVVSRRRNDSIVIGDDIIVTVVDIRGDKVRLGIQAPKDVPVHRRPPHALVEMTSLVSSGPVTPDEGAFLKEISANPGEEAPYLVFADWLEERGDPRAAYIRLQCELAKMNWNDPRRPELQMRVRETLRAMNRRP